MAVRRHRQADRGIAGDAAGGDHDLCDSVVRATSRGQVRPATFRPRAASRWLAAPLMRLGRDGWTAEEKELGMTRTRWMTLLAALVVALVAPPASAQAPGVGDLVVVNDIPDDLSLAFVAYHDTRGEEVGIGGDRIPAGGGSRRQSLTADDGWRLVAYDEADGEELDEDDALASAAVSIVAGQTTTVTARLRADGDVILVVAPGPAATPPAPPAPPAQVRVPSRIDTGGGGSAPFSAAPLWPAAPQPAR